MEATTEHLLIESARKRWPDASEIVVTPGATYWDSLDGYTTGDWKLEVTYWEGGDDFELTAMRDGDLLQMIEATT